MSNSVVTGMVDHIYAMLEYCSTDSFRSRHSQYQMGYVDAVQEIVEEFYKHSGRVISEELEEQEQTAIYIKKSLLPGHSDSNDG